MNFETVSQSKSALPHLTMIDYSDDWRYDNERLQIRGETMKILLSQFGHELDKRGRPLYSMESIIDCTHDWVSQGYDANNKVIDYYWKYYT